MLILLKHLKMLQIDVSKYKYIEWSHVLVMENYKAFIFIQLLLHSSLSFCILMHNLPIKKILIHN